MDSLQSFSIGSGSSGGCREVIWIIPPNYQPHTNILHKSGQGYGNREVENKKGITLVIPFPCAPGWA